MQTDIIERRLKIVFVSASTSGSRKGNLHYEYAGNLFYPTLAAVGFTPRILKPEEANTLTKFGIGLLDIFRGSSSNSAVQEISREQFRRKILAYQPSWVCFNGKEGARIYFKKKDTKDIAIGLQEEMIGETKLFVAPSTAFKAKIHFDESVWRQLMELIRK